MDLININKTRDNHLQQIEGIQDNYSKTLKHFVKWVRAEDRAINSDTIEQYFKLLDKSDYKARTVNSKRAAVKKRVRQIFNDMGTDFKMKLEQALKDIDKEIKPPRVNSQAIETDKVLSRGEFKDLISQCRTDRQKTYILFLMQTGCRVNEMTGIKLTDCIDLGEYYKINVSGKGKKERSVRIDKELYNFILSTYQGKKYLYETSFQKRIDNDYVSKEIKKIGQRIGRKITAHNLRHSFITEMIKEHPDKIDSISKYVGHSDVSTTIGMYLHTQLSNEELFNIIK